MIVQASEPPPNLNPRQVLALAILLLSRSDARLYELAVHHMETARTEDGRAYWAAYRDEDALRLGARYALWLEAAP